MGGQRGSSTETPSEIYKAEEFSDVTVNFDKIESTEEMVIDKQSKGPEIVKPDEVSL